MRRLLIIQLIAAFSIAAAALGPAWPAAAQSTGGAEEARAALEAQRAELERRVSETPDSAALRLGLAETLERLGAADAAMAAYRAAAERAGNPGERASAEVGMARLERRAGRAAEAAEHYQAALAADPARASALEGLATLLAALGRYRDAIPFYGRWIAAQPDLPGAWIGGAGAMILAGEHQRAAIALDTARQRFPEDLTLLDIQARHLAACPDRSVRDGARAVELGEELVAKVRTAESHETLAMAHAQAGHYERAVELQRELIDGAPEDTDAATLDRWRANLELYLAGRPCCAGDPPASESP
jgi:tetratricopeptide (TPR) repeat protein